MDRIGRYELVRILGEGGAGRVYEAVRLGPGELRQPVALKVLRSGGEELRREARLGGLLRHAHLVDVYELGEVDGRWFCAMELCEGTLSDRLPLPPRAVVDAGLQVCQALHYAHEELGLVHLDIKPDNLLFAAGAVKVADLGIARATGFDSRREIRGTRGYMAPEQAAGAPVDARSDIYALGVTLVELATGQRPVAEETVGWDEPVDAGTAAGAPPPWLAPVVQRCLDPDPEARWQSMSALSNALAELDVDGEPLVQVLPSSPGAQTASQTVPTPLGRARELQEISRVLATPGILAIKGPVGIGKSTLARVAAASWAALSNRPLWVCDLSACRGVRGALAVVAEALDATVRGDAVTALGRRLRARGSCLLLLDNADRVGGLTAVVDAWSALAPDLRVLITSRQPVDTQLGSRIDLGPLDLDASCALIVRSARLRGIDVAEDPGLSNLAERLEGIPLALELAAGRLGMLSVSDVIARLGPRLLRAGQSGRHSTLDTALEWGWDQLAPQTRESAARLSVFAGSFSPDAAEAVLASSAGSEGYDVLTALVEQSWLTTRDGRLRMLAPIRQFVARRLRSDDAERRHGAYFARLARDLEPGVRRWTFARDHAADTADLEIACRRALDRGDLPAASSTLLALWEVQHRRGVVDHVVELAEQALELGELDEVVATQIRGILGIALLFSGRAPDAEQLVRAALAVPAADAGPGKARLWLQLGVIQRELGRSAGALDALEQALRELETRPDRLIEATVLGNLAAVLHQVGRPGEAEVVYRRAIARHTAMGNHRSAAVARGNLGNLYRVLGRFEEANQLLRASITTSAQLHDLRNQGVATGNLAVLLQETGRLDEADEAHRSALAIHREVGNARFEGLTLGNLGTIAEEQGDLARARDFYDAAIESSARVGDSRQQGHWSGRLASVVADPRAADDLFDRGERLLREAGDPSLLAGLLARRAERCLLDGATTRATAWLEQAAHVAPATDREVLEVLSDLRARLEAG